MVDILIRWTDPAIRTGFPVGETFGRRQTVDTGVVG